MNGVVATDSGDVTVSVRGLCKTFGDFKAVDGVSFDVGKGEIFGFLGSNGAGKTTTIRMLCGLLRPSAGQARVGGLDVYTQPEQIKQNIGYMSQRFSLYEELTVGENIEFFSGVYGVPRASRRARKEEILELMGLRDRRKQVTAQLPGGWKQRLALGCAILHEPPALFLDEPTSGVDPVARRSFWELIYDLSRAGKTVFVTTHYMDEAEYCHRLALMNAGRLIALDTPRNLREGFSANRLMQLDTSDVLETLRAMEDEPLALDSAVFGAGLHVRVEDPEVAAPAIRARLAERGVRIKRFQRIPPSMEDVFVSMIEAEERKSK